MTDDKIAAALAEIRKLIAAAPAEFRLPLNVARASLTAGMLHGTAGKLLKAVEAALGHHQPVQLYGMVTNYSGEPVCGHDGDYDGDSHFEGDDGLWYCKSVPTVVICSTCLGDGGDGVIFPCGEYEAILTALTGKGADDA